MEYTTEDLSSVKKKITITVPASEIDSALALTISMYRKSVSLDGFRKGKVPANIIEKRFHKEVYNETTSNVINSNINSIIEETKVIPVSRFDFDGNEVERGKDYKYTVSFEIMPEFELPKYEGTKVEQEEVVVSDSEVDSVIERLQISMAKIEPISEARPAQNGDIANIDFSATDDEGKVIEGVAAQGFQMSVGEGQTIEDFENLVVGMNIGETKEGSVKFPDDFFNPELAGKNITMKVTLNSLSQRILPEINDEFAKKSGNFDSVEKLRESINDSYVKTKTDFSRSQAQQKLLDSLLEMISFELPETLVETHSNGIINEMQSKLKQQGQDLASLGTPEELVEQVRPDAEIRTRTQIFLLTVAKEKGISISDQEADIHLRRLAMQSNQDYNSLREYYQNNNLMYALKERLIADKAMDEIYSKAEIVMIPPSENEEKK